MLFPAYAGVIPLSLAASRYAVRALFPAYAGVILDDLAEELGCSAFPRLRGGDPNTSQFLQNAMHFSPPTRG